MSNQNRSRGVAASPDGYCIKVTCIGNLSDPVGKDRKGKDKYKIFDGVKDDYGVYIFLDESKTPLYVGEAAGQTLKCRITQYYTSSSGATFSKNYGGKDIFETALRTKDWSIVTISVRPAAGGPAKGLSRDKRRWIHVLEKALIGFLEPRYNKD